MLFQPLNTPQPQLQLAYHPQPKTNKHWSFKQKIKYSIFVTYFKRSYQVCWQNNKTQWLYWQKLSQFITTKNANQCRIFHKKIIQQYQTHQNVLLQLNKSIDSFRLWEEHYREDMIRIKNQKIWQKTQDIIMKEKENQEEKENKEKDQQRKENENIENQQKDMNSHLRLGKQQEEMKNDKEIDFCQQYRKAIFILHPQERISIKQNMSP